MNRYEFRYRDLLLRRHSFDETVLFSLDVCSFFRDGVVFVFKWEVGSLSLLSCLPRAYVNSKTSLLLLNMLVCRNFASVTVVNAKIRNGTRCFPFFVNVI